MAENDDAEDLAISFRSAGKPVRMSSPAKWRRAISLGDLTRDTPVEVEAGGRSQGVRPAGEVPALRRLFDELSPRPEADDAAPAAHDAQTPAEATAAAEPVEVAAAETPPPLRPISPPPVPPRRPTPAAVPADGKKGGLAGCLVPLGIVILLALVFSRGCSHRHAAGPAAETRTVYVTRQVKVRPRPASGNRPTAVLERGAALAGVWNDADRSWFRITAGPYDGGYVWGMDLADRARPDLAVQGQETRAAARAVTERREPDPASPAERDIGMGERLVVAGRLASGWWEVLNKGRAASTIAGVGYAPPETFDAPAAEAAPTATEPAPAGLGVTGCNQTDRPITVAYVFRPRDRGRLWKYKGWMRLAAGECKLLFLTNTADFYLRAETADDGAPLEWGGPLRRCVRYPGPFDDDLELGGTCPAGAKTAGFFRRTPANAAGTYTETFR